MSAFLNNIRPKVWAALFGALAVAVVTVGNSVISVYGDRPWINIVGFFVPVVAAWLQSEGGTTP